MMRDGASKCRSTLLPQTEHWTSAQRQQHQQASPRRYCKQSTTKAFRVRAAGFVQLFPVQAAAWRQLAGGHSQAHDLCISAPTGSGKTLAYALPVLSALIGCAHGSI